MNGTTRRDFLKETVMVAAATGGLAATAGLAADAKKTPAAAARPASDAKKPRASWVIACRDANLREIGEADIFSAMRAIGVEGVEAEVDPEGACAGLFGPEHYTIATPEGIRALRERLHKEKLKITAFCMANRFDERPEEELASVTRVARAAAELHVPAIRLDVVPRKLAGKEAEFLTFAVDIGRRLVKQTGDTGVRFGVENHGDTTNKPEFLRKLFGGIGSDRFGLTLDTGNFYWYGHPLSKLYDIYAEFADSVCHTHCKSIKYPEAERDKQRPRGWEYGKYNCPIDEGDIDFKKVAEILRKHKYRGDLCIENEALGRFPKAQRKDVLKRETDLLRQVAHSA